MDTKKKQYERKQTSSLDLGTMVYGKVPPQAKDLEEAVLGALMIEKDVIDTVLEILKPENFYVEAHQRIFKAMVELSQKSQPIDILTVSEQLRHMNELEMVGGPYYVTKLTNHVVSAANIVTHCHIIHDKFTKREMIRIGGQLIAEAYEDGTDVKDIMDMHEKEMTGISTDRINNNVQYIDHGIVKMIQRVEHLRNQKEDITGVPSDYKMLDNVTFGWQPTDLIILAARPAVGKTAFALNLARNAALHPLKPTPVALYSLEMSAEQLIMRIVSAESEVWLEKIARGKMEEADMKQLYARGVQKLSQAPLYIDDTPALNIFELRAKVRRLRNKHNIGLVIIDYLQLMTGTSDYRGNREQEVSQISRGLKELAKELKVPIIALSQLSRSVETRRGENKIPQLSDLRESGAIEQDADMVMFMYRPEYYDITADETGENIQGQTIIEIAKNRHGNLARGNDAIKLKALLHIQKFIDWSASQQITSLGSGGWKPVDNGAKLFIDDQSKMKDDEKDEWYN